jgi:hypothetical protein
MTRSKPLEWVHENFKTIHNAKYKNPQKVYKLCDANIGTKNTTRMKAYLEESCPIYRHNQQKEQPTVRTLLPAVYIGPAQKARMDSKFAKVLFASALSSETFQAP